MITNATLIQVAVVATLVAASYSQDIASLQAKSDHNRLVLVGKNLTWEQIRGFGLIVGHRKDMTGAVRAAVADTSARVEPTNDGFLLDLGPSGGMGKGNDGVVALTLDTSEVLVLPISVRRISL